MIELLILVRDENMVLIRIFFAFHYKIPFDFGLFNLMLIEKKSYSNIHFN